MAPQQCGPAARCCLAAVACCCCYLPLGLKTLTNNLCVAGKCVEATNIKLIYIN